jgi:hypothetical protein
MGRDYPGPDHETALGIVTAPQTDVSKLLRARLIAQDLHCLTPGSSRGYDAAELIQLREAADVVCLLFNRAAGVESA